MMMTFQQAKELLNRGNNSRDRQHNNIQHDDEVDDDVNLPKNDNKHQQHNRRSQQQSVVVFEEASSSVTMAETDDDEYDEDEEGTDAIGGGGVEEERRLAEEYESEEETQIAQAMARAAFTKSASSPMLNLLLKAAFQEEQQHHQQLSTINAKTSSTCSTTMNKRTREEIIAASKSGATLMRQSPSSSFPSNTMTRSFKKARRGGGVTNGGGSGRCVSSTGRKASPVRLSASAPSLKGLLLNNKQEDVAVTTTTTKPSEHLQVLLAQAGVAHKTYDYTSLSTMGFFTKLSPEQIHLYDTDLVRAVRDQDLLTLQDRLATIPSLHAGNKFGETILHASCRRAAYRIVEFLLTDGDHPVRVCCDYGRTVLHDAAWTCTPNFAVIDLLLNACPDLLYVCDRRGYTALDYVPKDQYPAWCDYLTTRTAARLRPNTLSLA